MGGKHVIVCFTVLLSTKVSLGVKVCGTDAEHHVDFDKLAEMWKPLKAYKWESTDCPGGGCFRVVGQRLWCKVGYQEPRSGCVRQAILRD